MSVFSKVRFILYTASLALVSQTPLTLHSAQISYSVDDKEEAFLVRRIAEFWKDQDFVVVKAQIVDFLGKYPKSKMTDHLRGILGDLYLQENAYEDALRIYNQIQTPAIFEKIVLNKLQCLYELNSFEMMIQEGFKFLTKSTEDIDSRRDEFKFLMAESYFRSAVALQDSTKKLDYFAKAEPLYEGVLNSSFNDPSMFALAEIYRLKKENQKAATFFLQLAERHPEKREDLLFHAALAQSDFDRKGAINTFSAIIAKDGSKAKDAALNHLILLFQEDRFQDVLETYPKMIQSVSAEKEPAVIYMVARSYFAKEDYANSSLWLKKYVAIANEPSLELRNALLMQLNSAQTLKNVSLYNETATLLQTLFPKDSELPQAIFIHAMMLKETGNFRGAEEKLEELIQNHPQFDNPESLLLEYSVVTHSNEQWEKCHSTLSLFLKKYPDSSYAPSAWKYLLSSGLNLLKQKESGLDVGYTKELFYDDLKRVLAQKDVLTASEKQECLFLQGKMGYELNKYGEALTTLNSYLTTYPGDAAIPEAHLLTALCHNKMKADPTLFCEHAEAALQGNPNIPNKAAIHLELYNVYLSIVSQNKSSLRESDLYELAAEHLYQAMQLDDLPVKLENRLWLANYYYDKSVLLPQIFETDGATPSMEVQTAYNRSRALLQTILTKNGSSKLIAIDKDHTFLEWEVVKLANLMGREGLNEKKIDLLRDLIEDQTTHPDWNWKLQKEALLELAKSYEVTKQAESSYDTFQFICDHYRKEPSFVSEYASLHAARLKFTSFRPDQKKEDNLEVFKVLADLKELQIRKSPASEPLHLEAALEYAWIRAQIAQESDRDIRYLFFLNRIQEDFNSTEDPMVTNYHKGLKENPSKAKLYAIYSQFLEAEMFRCNASLAAKEGRNADALEYTEKAKTILSSFAERADSSYYLKIRSQDSLAALKRAKIT